ncbi:MAG: GNAT family N-acetyltransferase, partial [Pseudomonadota bacterium]
AAVPVLEENVLVPTGGDLGLDVPPLAFDGDARLSPAQTTKRKLVVFPSEAGFDVLPDVDQITDYALEPNIFFSPRFVIPGLSRLDDRDVRLLFLHDQADDSLNEKRLGNVCMMMPFTVEKPGFQIGPDIVRAWSNPYGPYGLPLVERRGAEKIIDDLFATLGQPDVQLPKIVVFPNIFMDSPLASLIRATALSAGLPMATSKSKGRPWLDATVDADVYLRNAISSHHRRNLGRLWRKLEKLGSLEYDVARAPEQVRVQMEEFLLLENAGWKGRKRTSLAADRYRAAFAREAVNLLAERDRSRIFTLKLDGRVIASLIVFVEGGRAWTWKTTYDETLRELSPGLQLMTRVTETLLDDPNVTSADSCAVPDHPVMSRLWTQSRAVTTLVVGTQQAKDRDVRQVASQIDFYRSTKETAKSVADKVRSIFDRKR